LLPEAATLLDRVETRDTSGGVKVTWSARSGTVPARVGRIKDSEQEAFAGQMRGKQLASLWLPAGTALDEGDRVQVLGQTYSVAAVMGPVTWEITRRFLIEEV
jgi:hypothetical protein